MARELAHELVGLGVDVPDMGGLDRPRPDPSRSSWKTCSGRIDRHEISWCSLCALPDPSGSR
jgi:hypothetical protein